MLLVWLVVAAFLYWPFTRWRTTYQAPAISALLWPLMVLVFLGVIIWEKLLERSEYKKSTVFNTPPPLPKEIFNTPPPLPKEPLSPQEAGKVLAARILVFTSNNEERLALAKNLLVIAECDFKHEYYYPKGISPNNLRSHINFLMHSKKFINFYTMQERSLDQITKELEELDPNSYDPMKNSDKNLDNLDLFEIHAVFNRLVSSLNSPEERFQTKLLIIDGILQN